MPPAPPRGWPDHPLRRSRRAARAALLVALASALAAPAEELRGAAAEEFLRLAEVIDQESVGAGVTRPERLTLRHGERTARAVWKTIDVYRPVMDFHDGKPPEIGFRDSWKHEVAAYELDKLLGLGMVPPTVERRNRRTRGALQLWLEGSMTETERRAREVHAPDAASWNRQIYDVRLIRQLTHDTDFNNSGNLLIGADFKVWAIDHSRAFKTVRTLLAPGELTRFSRARLEALERLDAPTLETHVGQWLSRAQRDSLLARRDAILARARELVGELGEAAVLLP